MGSAFDGDEVSVRITKEARGAGKKREGEVVGIDNRNHTRVVGTMERKEKYCFVRPDDKRIGRDIFVPLERSKGAKTHYKVICEITKFNSDKGRCSPVAGGGELCPRRPDQSFVQVPPSSRPNSDIGMGFICHTQFPSTQHVPARPPSATVERGEGRCPRGTDGLRTEHPRLMLASSSGPAVPSKRKDSTVTSLRTRISRFIQVRFSFPHNEGSVNAQCSTGGPCVFDVQQ